MRSWFQRFMAGRYGADQFSRFLNLFALVLLILGIFLSRFLYLLGLVVLGYQVFRMFSRNTYRRRAENQWYLGKRYAVSVWFDQHFGKQRSRFQQRKVYRYFRCPQCRQELRVPRGRGKISITCPKCGTQFVKKS